MHEYAFFFALKIILHGIINGIALHTKYLELILIFWGAPAVKHNWPFVFSAGLWDGLQVGS